MMESTMGIFLPFLLLLSLLPLKTSDVQDDDEDDDEETEDEEQESSASRKDPAKAARKLLRDHRNNAMAAVAYLMSQLDTANSRARKAEKKLANGQGSIPEGSVLLNKDDAATWNKYQELGLSPDQVREVQTERDNLRAETTTNQQKSKIERAAGVALFNSGPLLRLAKRDDGSMLDIDVEQVDQDGEKVERAIVRDGDKTISLQEYAEQHWSDFLPALQSGDSDGAPRERTQQPARFQGQDRGATTKPRGGDSTGNLAKTFIKNRYPQPKH